MPVALGVHHLREIRPGKGKHDTTPSATTSDRERCSHHAPIQSVNETSDIVIVSYSYEWVIVADVTLPATGSTVSNRINNQHTCGLTAPHADTRQLCSYFALGPRHIWCPWLTRWSAAPPPSSQTRTANPIKSSDATEGLCTAGVLRR